MHSLPWPLEGSAFKGQLFVILLTGRLRSGWSNAGEPVVTPIHLSRAALASSPDQEFTELHMDG